MSNQGGCCGGGRKQSDTSQREAANTQPGKDNALAKTGSLPTDKTKAASTGSESPAAKTHHGSCCG